MPTKIKIWGAEKKIRKFKEINLQKKIKEKKIKEKVIMTPRYFDRRMRFNGAG